ncbi:MAG: M20 family peptidase, partial [Verrucomicrobiae bacterium]|nr:M20 family peptidase [Verrucomicrobiae bacterium]
MTSEIDSPSRLLQALVRIPSVNPDGDPASPHTGEAACSRFVGEFLANECGAEVHYDEVLPDRPNVIARLTPSVTDSGKPRILFAPHTDTVSVAGMTID